MMEQWTTFRMLETTKKSAQIACRHLYDALFEIGDTHQATVYQLQTPTSFAGIVWQGHPPLLTRILWLFTVNYNKGHSNASGSPVSAVPGLRFPTAAANAECQRQCIPWLLEPSSLRWHRGFGSVCRRVCLPMR